MLTLLQMCDHRKHQHSSNFPIPKAHLSNNFNVSDIKSTPFILCDRNLFRQTRREEFWITVLCVTLLIIRNRPSRDYSVFDYS